MWKRSYKALALGVVLGLIGPFLGAIFYYVLKLRHVDFGHFVHLAATQLTFTVPLLSFGAIVNLAIFFIFLQIDAPLVSRGVIFSTLLYAFFVVIAKFFIL